MEQTLGKSRVLLESVMALFTEQKVDHENRPQISVPKFRAANFEFSKPKQS
jgi:hypothetical protein